MGVHGTARFGERDDLERAKLVRNRPPGEFPEGLMVGWWFEDMYDFTPIEYVGDQHQLIVAGTGGGKFTTGIAPMLLGSRLEDSTVVVVDPKGEIAKLAGPYFQKPFADRPTVHLFDPWDMCGTGQTSALNVLDQITESNPNHVDDARALADAMIIPSGEKNTHWDNAARNLLTTLLLYVALSPKENENRHLRRVRDLITMVWAMPKVYAGPKRETLGALLFELRDSKLADGAVARGATAVWNREEKERSGIISSIDRDTSWMDSPQMKRVLQGKSVDLVTAGQGGHKYFVVIPPEFFMTHRAWLRLMVTAFAKAFKRTSSGSTVSQAKRWRHIVIDEFANLGEMSFILNDVAVARGYDVKYHLVIQDFSQLARVYSEGWESFINNSFQRFFAISDMFTAEYISRMLGATTVVATSESWGESTTYGRTTGYGHTESQSRTSGSGSVGGSRSETFGRSGTRSGSETEGTTTGRTFAPTQRPLQTPDEVRRLEDDWQFLFFRGLYPIKCWRPAYWEAFPSLPKFSLKEIMGTVGRQPKDRQELAYFTEWRSGTRLMRQYARPVPGQSVSSPPQPQVLPQPRAKRPNWILRVGLASVAVLLIWWLLPSRRHEISELAAIRPQGVETSRPAVTAPEILPRTPVPDREAMVLMPRGSGTRDFLINTMNIQTSYCIPGHGQEEQKLMEYLVQWASAKRPPAAADATFLDRQQKYTALVRQYLASPVWDAKAAGTAFSAIQSMIKFGIPVDGLSGPVLQRSFANGGCLLTRQPETGPYKPPVYAGAKRFDFQIRAKQ